MLDTRGLNITVGSNSENGAIAMQLDPRPFIDRLRWIRQYPIYREAPGRFAARSVAFTLRERFAEGDTMAFTACGGRRFRTPRNNISSFIAAVFDERDLNIVRFWRKALSTGSVFFDVGANIGLYTVPASLQVGPSGRVVCFEAHPVLCRFLRDNVALNGLGNVVVENMAAGERAGELRIAFNALNPGETRIALPGEQGETIGVISLDEYCASHRIARIDYIKLDVEGYEATVLRGAEKIIRASPDILLQTEYEPVHLGRYGRTEELAELLLGWEFKQHSVSWSNGAPHAVQALDKFAGEIIWSRSELR